jgi:hypothetical protein
MVKFMFKNQKLSYSVSCDLSAAPAPGQSAGSGTRPALIKTKLSNAGTE